MAAGFVFDLGALPQFLAVAGMLGLGVLLLALHFESRANRVFSLFLILRGLSMLSATEWQLTRFSQPEVSAFWVGLFPYFTIAAPIVLAYFVWIYPRPRRRFDPDWVPFALVVGAIAVLEAAYLLDPSLWGTFAVSAEGNLETVDQGPLNGMLGLLFLAYAVAGLAFAMDATDAGAGSQRRSLVLVSLAFTSNAIFDGVGSSLIVFDLYPFAFDPGMSQYLATVSLVPALAAPAVLALDAYRVGDAQTRRHALGYGVVCALSAAVALGATFLTSFGNIFLVATGILRLALPALVAYALLRHQLFDIDVKVRLGLEGGTVAGVFTAGYFVASELLEQVVPVEGAWLGVLAAAAIALALKPIHRMAHRLAMRVLPASEPIEDLDEAEGVDLYRQQAQIVWSDRNVTDKERRALDNLRSRLGLEDRMADRIEAEAGRAAVATHT